MKRLLPFMVLALLGAGCAKPPTDVPGTDDNPPQATETPTTPEPEQAQAALSSRTVFRSWDDGERERCAFELVYPQFDPPSSDVARTWETVNRELERASLSGYVPTSTDGTFDAQRGADTYVETCRAELKELAGSIGEDETSYMRYEQRLGYDVELWQSGLLSLLNHAYSYSGGAHGLPWIGGITLTVPEGQVLTLGDLVQADQLKPFMQMVRREVRDQWSDALFPEADDAFASFVDNHDPITDEEREELSSYNAFYLTPEGFVFYWNVYDISPYAAGQPTVTIPYRAVSDWLRTDSPLTPIFASVSP